MAGPSASRVDPSALFQALVESADDAITSTDLQETITSWNRAAERLYGYRADEVIGESNRIIIPPDRYAEEDAVVRRITAGEGVQHLETVRVRKNGSRVEVAITASAIRGNGTAIVGISKIARDISGRKDAERNGSRLAAIVESSDDAIVSKDLNGLITTWNPAAERMFGYTAQEAVGRSIRLIIPESHQGEENEILERIRRGEQVQHFETIRCRKDGSCLPISVTLSPIRNAAGVIIGASKIVRDITDRKRAEAEAQRVQRQAEFIAQVAEVLSGPLEYEAKLKGLTDLAVPSLADWAALDVLEEDGHIRRLAIAHSDPAKSQLDTEHRRRFEDPTGPSNTRQVIRTGKSAMCADVTDDMIVAVAKGDQERVRPMRALGVVSCMCVALTTSRGTIAALTLVTAESGRRYTADDLRFAEDVASRAALMVENARAYVEIRKTNRLKDEFLATLSHELRTPLNAILGYARMLRGGMLAADKYQRTFETIERNSAALTQMVEDILDVSRVVSGKMRLNMQAVELPLVVHEAIATVTPAAEAKDIRVETAFDPQVGPVSGDPDRLRQIVWNLMMNAVKFTPKHGRIQVRIERVNSSVEIVVSDTGMGIAPHFLPHIFERFRQGESGPTREHAGLGLGLAIVRNLVELHGGTVYATSGGEGKGATFRVRLPLRIVHPEPQPEQRRIHPRQPAPAQLVGLPSLNGTHVLAVDDDADALGLLREMLEAVGASVSTAMSGRAALEIVETDRPDVLIADLGMPQMDGFELIRQLRASDDVAVRDIPAAALTAYARSEDRAKSLQHGFEMHLAKPIDPAELVSAVQSLARRRHTPTGGK
ncbi:MAG TPA: PAS domain S-box protein [Vicinamibacterales bacterium]|nr:PAS domain S-box protein [Vicinamibacterales bacterium]